MVKMVNKKLLLKLIKLTYQKQLGSNICLLVVGGSIGRKNNVDGWSDIDLFLVLENINIESLQLVKKSEKKIKNTCNMDVDTLILSRFNFEKTKPFRFHSKVKNFLFYLPKEKILIAKRIKIPRINKRVFNYGFYEFYAEQEKNFLHRNIKTDFKDAEILRKVVKKNIKIIFLITRKFLMKLGSHCPTATYKEIINRADKILPKANIDILKKYEWIRQKNQLKITPLAELKKTAGESVQTFNEISKIIIEKTNN